MRPFLNRSASQLDGRSMGVVLAMNLVIGMIQCVAIAFALGTSWSNPSRAQATRTTPQHVLAPPEQRALTVVLSQFNELDAGAPNRIQREKIAADYKTEFCAKIPRGSVAGWYGYVEYIDNNTSDKSLKLTLAIHTDSISGGAFGVVLELGNFHRYGITLVDTPPHAPTTIPIGSPLYDAVAQLRDGDTVRFSGTFIPYITDEVCHKNLDSGYFALVRFTDIQRVGWDVLIK